MPSILLTAALLAAVLGLIWHEIRSGKPVDRLEDDNDF